MTDTDTDVPIDVPENIVAPATPEPQIITKDEMIELRKTEIVNMVCRQTSYSPDEARAKLEDCKYNYLKVIQEYVNPSGKPKVEIKKQPKTINQTVYSEIRSFMDKGVRQYEARKKMAERQQLAQNMEAND